MSASARRKANRQNAAGPHQMTEAGKQTIRTNAIRHGLTSKIHVVLAGEDGAFYTELLESLQTQYAPANTQEEMLVHQIAQHHWRLIRARNMETGALSISSEKMAAHHELNPAEPDDVSRGLNQAEAYNKYFEKFAQIGRYEAAIERSYYRAIHELQKIQAQRIRFVSQNPASPAQTAVQTADQTAEVTQSPTNPPPVEIRFVSQNPATPAAPVELAVTNDSFCSATPGSFHDPASEQA